MTVTPQNEATDEPLLKIGEVEAQSQIPVKTIRYYETLGLVQAKRRTSGRFRLFSLDVLPRLAFIKRAQSLGFSLNDIQHILQIYDQGERPCSEVRQKLQAKLDDIDQRIQQLQLLKSQLLTLMQEDGQSVADGADSDSIICPILQANLAESSSPERSRLR